MQKNQKILAGAAIALIAVAALIFKSGMFSEELKAEVSLLNNSPRLEDNIASEKSEVLRVTVTAKNADVFPKSFDLQSALDLDLNCEIWTAYGDKLLAEGGGNREIKLNFVEAAKLEKDLPVTWRFFCDLSQMEEG
ncbi:MAG: hypothetical protein ACRCZE_00905, partial [Candidatus Altimarinota bacterium]